MTMVEFLKNLKNEGLLREYALACEKFQNVLIAIRELKGDSPEANAMYQAIFRRTDFHRATIHSAILTELGCQSGNIEACCGKCPQGKCAKFEFAKYIEDNSIRHFRK